MKDGRRKFHINVNIKAIAYGVVKNGELQGIDEIDEIEDIKDYDENSIEVIN